MKKIVVFRKKNVIRAFSFFTVVFILLLLSSCMTFFKPGMTQPDILPTDYEPTEGSGYIYGRFFKAHIKASTPLMTTRVIVIRNLDNSDTYSFSMESGEENTLQILTVPPGNYRIETVEYTNLYGLVESSESFAAEEYQEGYEINFVVAPNTAVYLGDFILSVDIIGGAHVITTNFGVYPPVNKFKGTTADIQEKYPFLKEADITFVSHLKNYKPSDDNEDTEKRSFDNMI